MSERADPASGEGFLLKLPQRMISGGRFMLPLRGCTTSDGEPPVLPIPLEMLSDPGVGRLVRDEWEGEGFEAAERRALFSLVGPGAAFVDIGAHFGLYSLAAACSVPDVRVLAVEPHPVNYSVLREAVTLNRFGAFVSCCEAAVGAAGRNAVLRANTSMGGHVVAGQSGRAGDISLVLRSLDGLVDAFSDFLGDKPALWLKIDTEGRELDVLQGGVKLLSSGRVRGLLWESHVGGLPAPQLPATLGWLGGVGFRSYRASPSAVLSLLEASGSVPELERLD